MITKLTPIECRNGIYFKRDDYFTFMGLCGAKVRGAKYMILKGIEKGYTKFTTVGHRKSPQIHIVGTIVRELCTCYEFVGHTPEGELPEAFEHFNIIQHKAGYNNVIAARCHEYAKQNNFYEIPFGMEDVNVMRLTMEQVAEIPKEVKRIVIPVGSGVNLCGVLMALRKQGLHIPVLGVTVGKSPLKLLQKYAPFGWQTMCTLVAPDTPYSKPAVQTQLCGVELDPIYEAKCIPFVEPNDLLWVVGIRTF